MLFSRVAGGMKKRLEIQEGRGGLIFSLQSGNSGEVGGLILCFLEPCITHNLERLI